MLMNEVTIFKPNSRSKEATIASPINSKVIDALQLKMGNAIAAKTKKAFATMKRDDIEFLQFRVGERRFRVRQIET